MAQRDEILAQQVGQALVKLRRQRGMTQEALAEASHTERETISRIERARLVPTLPRLAAIADALDVSLAELLGGSSPRPSDQSVEIVELLRGLRDEDRVWVKQWLVELCDRLKTSSKGRRRI